MIDISAILKWIKEFTADMSSTEIEKAKTLSETTRLSYGQSLRKIKSER